MLDDSLSGSWRQLLPDGRLVATTYDAVCVVSFDGSPAVPIYGKTSGTARVEGQGHAVTFSPEGKFTQLRVWVPGLPGTYLASEEHWSYFPVFGIAGGAQIVFREGSFDGSPLVAYSPATGTRKTLLPPVKVGNFGLGDAIAYAEAEGAVVYSLENPIPGDAWAWTHRSLLADGSTKELCVGCAPAITSPSSPWIFTSLDPHDESLGSSSPPPPTKSKALLINALTGEKRDVSSLLHVSSRGRFSADGKKLFALSMKNHVARYDLATGTVEELGTTPPIDTWNITPQWASTPDGSVVLYTSRIGPSSQVSLFAASTPALAPTTLTTVDAANGDRVFGVLFTSDSKHALYGTYNGDFSYALATKVAHTFPADLDDGTLQPAAGGSVVFGTNGEVAQIRARDLGTGKEEVVAEGYGPIVSKDGKSVAYKTTDGYLTRAALP